MTGVAAPANRPERTLFRFEGRGVNDPKGALRDRMRSLLGRLTEAERIRKSAEIWDRVGTLAAYRRSGTILFYANLPQEVATDAAAQKAIAAGKRVLVPRIGAGGRVEACAISSWGGDLRFREGGRLREPLPEIPAADLREIDWAWVPGLAFTRDGRRLGRGGGFYDRLLPKISGAFKAGLAYDFQIVPDLPVEPHDVKVDEVYWA